VSVTTFSPSSKPIGVHFDAVSRRFEDGVTALDSVSFTVQPGELSVLVGPSGCGKTTALRMIGGLDQPNSGAVTLHSAQSVSDFVERSPGLIGYCFQEPRLLPWRTVLENVCLPFELGANVHADGADAARDALEKVGLLDALSKRPHELSGGMRMRVAIARALVTQPRLLLLDEPFGALDEISRARLDDVLLELWSRIGVTIVMVTHSLAEAVYLGQTVHILSPSPGRLAQTMEVRFESRTPETRLTPEFAKYVATAHSALKDGEAHK
jgi:NitT/TauT family transport system ATP-binding protein